MIKKGVLFFILSLFLLSCTQNKFEGEFPIDAEVIAIERTVVSIKYQLGNSEIYDDLDLEDKNSIRLEWKHKDIKNIQLRVSIYGYESNAPTRKTLFKYFYGANLIAEHQKFDYETLLSIAKNNETLFTWQYRDGVDLSVIEKKKNEKTEEEQGKKL